MDLDCS